MAEVIHIVEFAQNFAQRRGSDLAHVAGQDQGHRHIGDEPAQLGLEPFHAGFAQAVQGGHGAGLEEVGHRF